ncbi:MAG: MBL fold metallo-hydrolase [Gammaproteobacteria bacterium]|nr:MAG: MBL fold metallo-hydrolase [Gammaproteobacteria bacterium]
MNTLEDYSIHTLELGPMENFVYIIHDHATDRAAVVDPAWDVAAIKKTARDKQLRITDILLTHSHHDHVNGVAELLHETDAQLHLLKEEARFWGSYLDLPTLHHGGDKIMLGKTPIRILHTPGHTPGSACYQVPGNLITGDTLFVFGCGRCDLTGGDPNEMFETLKKIVDEIPADAVIHPGHNYSEAATSTLEGEMQGNPFLHFENQSNFVEYRMRIHDRVRCEPYGPVSKDLISDQYDS